MKTTNNGTAAFESLTERLWNLAGITYLYCGSCEGVENLRRDSRFMVLPMEVIRCGNDYGIAAESYVLAGAVMNSVMYCYEHGEIFDLDHQYFGDVIKSVSLMLRIVFLRNYLFSSDLEEVFPLLNEIGTLELELRKVYGRSRAFGDIEIVIRYLAILTCTEDF